MFKKILVALDGSEGSKKALLAALVIAKRFDAELQSISIKEQPSHYAATVGEVTEDQEEISKYYAQVTADALDLAEKEGVPLKCEIRSGHEVQGIVEFARHCHFDLLIVGFMGHSRVFDRFWGGTSQNLTRIAPCAVLVVK
jgi:nucleotide-binding universal stress UspA family protein